MRLPYPDTQLDDSVDTLAGISFPDPYRGLEQESESVRAWQHAQATLAIAHVREWAPFDHLRELVARCNTERFVTLPRYAGGRWFRTRIAPDRSHAVAVVANDSAAAGQVVFDPAEENREQAPFLSWIAPSPDGRVLALGLCGDGSESNTIRLIDVDTGLRLAAPPEHTLMDNWTGGVQWLPDSSGFFFTALDGAATEFVQNVHLHRRGRTPVTVPQDIGWTCARDWRMVVVSRDGRYAVAIERLRNPIPVALARLDEEPLRWKPFVTSIESTVAGHVLGDHYIAVTDVGAPRGRLIAIDLHAPDPNDVRSWKQLVGESDAVLRTVTPVGDVLYLTEFVNTYTRVRIVNARGEERGQVPLPERVAINELPFPMMNLVPRGHPEEFVFAYSSFSVSPGIYSHAPDRGETRTLSPPSVRLEDVVVEDLWAESSDGTRIPYHVVRRRDRDPTHPQPTLIYAYGGFNVALAPQFPGPMAAFVVAGGTFVHAHLRGGGEFGVDWWKGGRLESKQHCYEDLYAVAEDMVAARRCTPGTLAVTGSSNGGLLAAVAATQRPDLWQVAIPRVPILDLIGSCRDPYGQMCALMEYADVTQPDEVRRLATFSPYHLVKDGSDYPAVFLEAGDTDPRCPAWHARKFAARLQLANRASGPILLHVWENAGHGWATNKDLIVDQYTEWLAFTLRHLGVERIA